LGHATFEWSPDGNFLISTQDVTVKGTEVSHATEWIGWDPSTSQIRSWSFVADGAIGENTCNIGRRSVKHPVISVTKTMPVTGARTTAVKKAAIPTTAKAAGSSAR
jgi:hypothetical protein